MQTRPQNSESKSSESSFKLPSAGPAMIACSAGKITAWFPKGDIKMQHVRVLRSYRTLLLAESAGNTPLKEELQARLRAYLARHDILTTSTH